jgi:hypothetical protein
MLSVLSAPTVPTSKTITEAVVLEPRQAHVWPAIPYLLAVQGPTERGVIGGHLGHAFLV